jgi:PTH1 family peptidyl-tRNA hydrolase
MKLIIGLGNPGSKYETTRHNVGFMVIDLIADMLNADFKTTKHRALVAEGRLDGEKVLLVKPQTFMNLSGEAVLAIQSWFKLSPQDVIVIYDDLDLAVGRLRIREKGSAGGQKGMASIIKLLGTEEIMRIKIGIGRPPADWQAADYVLSVFSDEEWEVLQELLPKAAKAALLLAKGNLNEAMNMYNRRSD